jgi:hypothetical protein
MWNKLRTSFSTPRDPLSSREIGYTPLHNDASTPFDSTARVKDGRGVYWAFWILGAGVLLAWNGQLPRT